MEHHNAILKKLEKRHAGNLMKEHGLIVRQLQFGDCDPLYLAKPDWTNRFVEERESTIGVFCAIWISAELLEQNLFAYNIHSKAIRKLPDHKLTSIKFASEFRNAVRAKVSDWPNIRLDYGPANLLEGRDTCELDNFAQKVEERIFGFVEISEHIDDLLEAAAMG